MPPGRRAARGRGRPPATNRELLAYNAGRRHRRSLALPIGQMVPTEDDAVRGLEPHEVAALLSLGWATWWHYYWAGWRDGEAGLP